MKRLFTAFWWSIFLVSTVMCGYTLRPVFPPKSDIIESQHLEFLNYENACSDGKMNVYEYYELRKPIKSCETLYKESKK